jgi:hypothetical protein
MSQKNQLVLIVCLFNCLSGTVVLAAEPVDKDITSSKHFHFPFIHVDVARHKDGTKDVDVKAPFTKVHNPAGPNNAHVKAPFTRVDHGSSGAADDVKAPKKQQT